MTSYNSYLMMENGYGGGYGSNQNSSMERSLVSVQATVMHFDNEMKRWMATGYCAGLSRVQVNHDPYNNTYRIFGTRQDNGEVSLNCEINGSLVYNRATPIFHQWKKDGRIIGLHFNSENEARDFASTVETSLDKLNNEADYRDENSSSSAVTHLQPTAAATTNITTTTTVPERKTSTATIAALTSAASAAAEAKEATVVSTVDATPAATATTTTDAAAEENSTTTSNTTETTPKEPETTAETTLPSSSTTTSSSSASTSSPETMTSPKYQTNFQFTPKTPIPTITMTNDLSPTSSSSIATSSPPTTSETVTWKPEQEPTGHNAHTKNYETNGANVVQSYYSPDAASNIPSDPPQETSTPGFVPPPAPPPPPPPPAPIYSTTYGGLGSALQSASLRKSPKPDEESGSGNLVRSASPSMSDLQSSMMSEMAKKLEQRKRRERESTPTQQPAAAAPASASCTTPSQLEPVSYHERRASFDRGRSPIPFQSSSASSKPPAVNNAVVDSPKFPRSKRIQSLTGQEGNLLPSSGGTATGSHGNYATSAELEAVKQELMNFVKSEISKAKQEIIDAVRLLLMNKH